MESISSLNPQRVFHYFEKISHIPRGSGNQDKISSFCQEFANSHSLKVYRDSLNNIIIYKDGTKGYENSEPIILQGHLDMVCQKTVDSEIDFEKDGIDMYVDGEYVRARNTTLGGDDGVAVAMILAILESDDIPHPPIEAVFTTDEEIGMVGALNLDFEKLLGKRMLNLDSEEQNVLTVSCAGGSDFKISVPCKRERVVGEKVKITISGLAGGHSGVMINMGRVNADILAGRLLNYSTKCENVSLISADGGDKGNAIPLASSLELVCDNYQKFSSHMNEYVDVVINEISDREPGAKIEVEYLGSGEFEVIDKESQTTLINTLLVLPNGVMEMSATIDNLVETSLNLGIMKTEKESILLHYTLRSNKMSALEFLEERLKSYADVMGLEWESFGHYPAWEYCRNSKMQKLYQEIYKEQTGDEINVCAIHAGLECGVFASHINDFDCISIGPDIKAIHTTDEALSISSTQKVYEILLEFLKRLR